MDEDTCKTENCPVHRNGRSTAEAVDASREFIRRTQAAINGEDFDTLKGVLLDTDLMVTIGLVEEEHKANLLPLNDHSQIMVGLVVRAVREWDAVQAEAQSERDAFETLLGDTKVN